MNIGVMSDTHGNRGLMHRVADQMVRDAKVAALFHLGDDYGDALALSMAGHPVRMVPGLWCPEYHSSTIPRTLIEECEGLAVACTHDLKDLRPPEQKATIILYGHTHEASIEHRGSSLRVNPGHLKERSSRGQQPSYAVMWIDSDEVRVTIHERAGQVRQEASFPRSELA